MMDETSTPTIDSVETLDVVLSDLVDVLGAELMYEHNRNRSATRKRLTLAGEGSHRMAQVVEFEDAYDGEEPLRPVLKPRDFLNPDGSLKSEMEIPVWDDDNHLGMATVTVQPQ